MATIRSPCCGYNLAWCVELKGDDLWSCSHKIESVNLRKCPYDHWLTNKVYLSASTVTSIFRSFTYKTAAKTGWHRYGTKLRHCHPMHISAPQLYHHIVGKDLNGTHVQPGWGKLMPTYNLQHRNPLKEGWRAHRSETCRCIVTLWFVALYKHIYLFTYWCTDIIDTATIQYWHDIKKKKSYDK